MSYNKNDDYSTCFECVGWLSLLCLRERYQARGSIMLHSFYDDWPFIICFNRESAKKSTEVLHILEITMMFELVY